ncbi:related to RLM1 - MADS-box transcription factor [Ustilago trichophora]|uniref:Related to RLM1 - MADS-box transcription factor n=1 Tax=Ustilago trichophora TaxID=86804 RepID=A0A5C3EIL7_9BASI|nr:related to RLM1 - MADS-box transcription factor [Ustilago trichophora]
MGRKKIKIQPIKEDRNRSVTYLKRKAGLFKKAHELAVLTDSQVAVIVFGHNGKLAEFCSTDIDLLLLRYTEYEGAAERKGPQNYLNLDKDSDDNDDGDNDNDDNDNASGDGPDDDFVGHSGSNGGGRSGSNGRSGGRVSGIKRKAEPSSPPRNNQLNGSNAQALGAFGVTSGLMGAGASSSMAKQTINAAIRQKSQNRTAANMALPGQTPGQGVFDPLSFGQPFMSAAGMPPHSMVNAPIGNMAAMVGTNSMMGQGASSTNPTRAEAIASMSIPMPTNDRVPIFVSPATPGFGLTPGGTVTTPGGRRFSFSDVLTRGSSGSMMQRPVTTSSLLGPTFFQNEAFSLSASPQPAFNSISPSMSPQPPQDPSLSAATAAAAFAVKGAMDRDAARLRPGVGAMEASSTPFPDLRSSAHLMSRPASTGVQRSIAPTYGEVTYAPTTGAAVADVDNLASPAHIVRPFTASGHLEAPSTSTHLVPPVAGLQGSIGPQGFHANTASPAPHPGVPNTFNASAFIGADLKPSATPLGSQASSATPELVRPPNTAAPGVGLAASASRSSMSTDEETPPGNGNALNTMISDNSKLDASWLSLGQGMDQKPTQAMSSQANLVQPVPINPTQTLGSVPFDLSFPAQPTQ